MPDLVPITEAEENRLLTAVSGAIKRHNQGSSANDAIAKAAAAEGLNSEFTRRAVHMFNTAKTIRHIGEHRDDGDKRAASFEIADPDEVLRILTAGIERPAPRVKSASTAPGETPMRDFATLRPGMLPALVKEAAAPYLGDPDEKYKKVSRLLNAQRIRAEQARTNAAALTAKRAAAFDRLVDSFRDPASARFDVFREKTEERCGASVRPVLEALGGRVKAFGKSASFAALRQAADHFDAAMSAAAEAGLAKQAYDEEQRELEALRDTYARMRKEAGEKSAVDAAPAAPAQSSLGQWLDDYLAPLTAKKVEPKDTGFADRVRSIDAQAQLAGLLATDDVIGRGNYHPDDVYSAYNELTRLTPTIANQPLVLRSALRQYLESADTGKGLSTFDADQVAKTLATSDKLQTAGGGFDE